MSNQQTFTRKEVIALLKKQRDASATSFGRMPVNPVLVRGLYSKEWGEENIENHKRLARVAIIKF